MYVGSSTLSSSQQAASLLVSSADIKFFCGAGLTIQIYFRVKERKKTCYLPTRMRLSGILICILVVALDIAAGIIGIHAYMAQNQVRHLRFFLFECREPSHEAFKLGVAAASLLLIAHIIANVAGGCICYGSRDELRNSPVNKQIAGISLLLAWIILVIGFALLTLGAMSNNHSKDYCSLSRHKFLWMGGVLCFVHGAIISAYYVTATAVITMGDRGIKGLSMTERG